jgi:hypothetical protein
MKYSRFSQVKLFDRLRLTDWLTSATPQAERPVEPVGGH